MARGRCVGRWKPLDGGGRRERGLQVDGLVEELVADHHHQGEEAQLEVAVGDPGGDTVAWVSDGTMLGKLHGLFLNDLSS